MTDHVHYIPVGFDFERLIQPISQGADLPADRVILLHSSPKDDNSEAGELAERMAARLAEAFDKILGIPTTQEQVDIQDIYEYETMFEYAYLSFLEELDAGNHVYVNISSMPRTVAFAFATAASTLVAESSELREQLHTYYVAPRQYLVLDLIEELEREHDFLEERLSERGDLEMEKRAERLSELMDEVRNYGVTRGAEPMNGNLHVEFPAPPVADLREFEELILEFLHAHGATASTSKLATELASTLEIEYDSSFQSRVQYNVRELESKGYIIRTPEGNRYRTDLTKIGKLWANTHL
ncbi:HFX_2341 family transcriptional regulator domain-containing protein [Halomarina pelagica]|uniref:HFX_2341 family transcriptional regulator domain-containing protein n=1 Tax=Halomarina pelagica TaxID=2961599 RepID=UPI0020C39DDC|nr:DUF6293 family protein [Halomarina sp. BND7]